MELTPVLATRLGQRILDRDEETPSRRYDIEPSSARTNRRAVVRRASATKDPTNTPRKCVPEQSFRSLVENLILDFKNSCKKSLLNLRIADIFDLSSGVYSEDLGCLVLPSALKKCQRHFEQAVQKAPVSETPVRPVPETPSTKITMSARAGTIQFGISTVEAKRTKNFDTLDTPLGKKRRLPRKAQEFTVELDVQNEDNTLLSSLLQCNGGDHEKVRAMLVNLQTKINSMVSTLSSAGVQ